jgi:hypothetical protein
MALTAPLPPDIRRHLLAAFAAIGPDAAQSAINGLIRVGVADVEEGRSLFLAAMIGGTEDRGFGQ